jgi:hypothetical protein
MALFVAKWIEEAVPIISVVADRSGFDLIKSYEEWLQMGMRDNMVD